MNGICHISFDDYLWDANGNINKIVGPRRPSTRAHYFNEENRLAAKSDWPGLLPLNMTISSSLSSYLYSADGERVWKFAGTATMTYSNGLLVNSDLEMNKTFYPTPQTTFDKHKFYKHYFIGSERICTSMGQFYMTAANTPPHVGFVNPNTTAGSFIAAFTQTVSHALDSVGYSGNIAIDPDFNCITTSPYFRTKTYYYHYNHQGSVSLVTYQNGTLQQHLQYLPYGGIFVDHRPNSYASTYTFSAKEKDAESGYTYFGARYYSDNIMQWLSVDPKSDKYPSTSPYMYCLGNPIMYLDPQGESSHIPPALIGYIMEKYSSNSKIKTVGYAMQHPVNAVKVGLSEFPGFGLSNIASNFEVNLRNEAGFTKNEGSQGNAYRHTLWQSMITRDMGVEHAKRIGNAHEDNTDINPMQHIYKNLKNADNAVDLLNNAIGRRIGINNKNATNQQMSEIVLEEYRTNGLWEAQKTNEGYKIQKTQLSQEKYNEALNVLRTKGNDGMNK